MWPSDCSSSYQHKPHKNVQPLKSEHTLLLSRVDSYQWKGGKTPQISSSGHKGQCNVIPRDGILVRSKNKVWIHTIMWKISFKNSTKAVKYKHCSLCVILLACLSQRRPIQTESRPVLRPGCRWAWWVSLEWLRVLRWHEPVWWPLSHTWVKGKDRRAMPGGAFH